jgi:putative ABC transport system permease protein
MFFNYLKVAFRNIIKYKAFSLINVFGLAVSMSVAMLIIVMVADQKRYDQFHDKKDRTYRLLTKAADSPIPYASTPVPLAGTLRSEYPAIEEATQLVMGVGGEATYNEKTLEMRGFFAD